MSPSEIRNLFNALYNSTTSSDVHRILRNLGDRDNVGPGVPIGSSGFVWRLLADNLSNQSSVGLATKPGRSITERVTNAFDAVLEKRAQNNTGALPPSPGLAAERWFGRPISGPETGMFGWRYQAGQYDKLASMVLLPSEKPNTATIDVIDRGSGIPNRQLPSTILSLQQGNKITKKYLAGAYGQGGASTLSFCDYALIISRSTETPDVISFTVVRILSLSDDYKVDAYAYLANADDESNVPFILDREELTLFPFVQNRGEVDRALGGGIISGTIVRHFAYRLTNLDGKLGPAPGNLYHFLQLSLFDPLLPLGIIDMRSLEKPRREVILGSRNRLMKRADQASSQEDEDDPSGKVQVKHHRAMEYFAAHGGDEPNIGIEYWVVFAYRKVKEKIERRSYSNELFVNKQYPIIGTVNGQNHGELPAQLIREAGFPLLSRHMIIHIDASKVGSRVIRELFATNREGFKEGPVLSTLQSGLLEMMREDAALAALERELVESIATQATKSASDDVKRQVIDLLMEAGFRPQEPGPGAAPGRGPERPIQPPRPGPVIPDPLDTLPFPEVTKWKIVYPRSGFELPVGNLKSIIVETDADAAYDVRGLISLRAEPAIVDKASQTRLKAGRMRWRIKAASEASTGSEFLIVCTLTKPDGIQLISDVIGTVTPAPIDTSRSTKTPIPYFDIIGIHPSEDLTVWNSVWPDLDAEDSSKEKLASVAYKVLKTGEQLKVYYSKAFAPLEKQVSKLSFENSPVLVYFTHNYEVWIGYHAILQHTDGHARSSEDQNGQLEEERCRVATMQIKEAMRMSDIMHKLQLAQAHESSDSE